MCIGGEGSAKSADEFYKKKKVPYGDLPSLSVSEKSRKPEDKPKYDDVRAGVPRRTLLNKLIT